MKGDQGSIFCSYQPLIFATGNNTPPHARSALEEVRSWGKGKTLKSTQMHHFYLPQNVYSIFNDGILSIKGAENLACSYNEIISGIPCLQRAVNIHLMEASKLSPSAKLRAMGTMRRPQP